MPAFNGEIVNKIANNIHALFQRRSRVGGLHLTNEEFIQTFVPTEARDVFRYITPLLSNGSARKFQLATSAGELAVYAIPRGTPSPPVPRIMVIQPDAPQELVERINYWITHGGDVSREFGRVTKVFTELNAQCSRVAMRYYWPTILALCSESDATKGIVKELQELRTPNKLHSLPLGLMKACRLTADTIATARLLPADVEMPVYSEGMEITAVPGQKYEEDFGTFYGSN